MQITTEKLEFYEELERAYDTLKEKHDTLMKESEINKKLTSVAQSNLRAFKRRVEEEIKEVLLQDEDLSDAMADLCDSLGLDFPVQTLTIEVEIPFGVTIDSITDSNGDSVDWTI